MPRPLRYRDDLLHVLRERRPSGGGVLLVAIGGGGGAGKSHLARFIQDNLDAVAVIRADDFSRPAMAGWEASRFREQVLDPLLQGRAATYQAYDWNEDRLGDWREVEPAGIVVAEGVGVISRAFAPVWEVSVWVDCPREIRLRRGVRRDGPAAERVWVEEWMPEEDRFFETDKPRDLADFVVNGHEGAAIEAGLAARLIDSLRYAGVEVVVDGGWGVDALLGRQTRRHDDLDVVVAMDLVEEGIAVLSREGFTLTVDERPVRMLFHDLDGHVVEFHTVVFREEGGWQAQPDGSTFLYRADDLHEIGTIGGREVRCISAELQVLCHAGYEHSDKDHHDLRALRGAFNIHNG